MIPDLIEKLLGGGAADPKALEEALHRIMVGEVPQPLTAGLLVALRVREPDAATLAACARAMRAHRIAVQTEVRPLIDTCGTGGDRAATFNISTAAALVVSAAGGAVAKHGNRSVSSKAGSADVLEASGASLSLGPKEASMCLDAAGFAFLFAPVFHPAMANVAPVRKALGIRTLFNLLGPLANPALAQRQLLGVYDPAMTRVMAEALMELGTESALVIHCEGLDEIGLHGVTQGHFVNDGKVERFTLEPDKLGLNKAPIDALRGGDASANAEILSRVLGGEEGPRADVVALNAAAALGVAGLSRDLAEGLEVAREVLRSGGAARVLTRYVETSRRLADEEGRH
ncbi:MAG TPA: anthranilate phosphoribosyltransferase [Vicinamibacteria bacterium]|nr:anthranilate phosphoribosyltransferase [Vicinamibacteria bacterium]